MDFKQGSCQVLEDFDQTLTIHVFPQTYVDPELGSTIIKKTRAI